MSKKKDNMLISDTIQDQNIRDYFYLDLSIDQLIDKMNKIELKDIGNDELIPFWAKVRGYTGGVDKNGDTWLIKAIPQENGASHKIQEIAYYIDFILKTPSAPTTVLQQNGIIYRATKQALNAMQLGSYNYLQKPFIKMLANDLLNRWLFFDEDRNPNNYLVKYDNDNEPFIIAIDYNKADLETKEMKILGLENRFGWNREEKTRFLTLLKPENFDSLCIEDFEQRLLLMTALDESKIIDISTKVFSYSGLIDDHRATAKMISDNLIKRINYLDHYFRKWFKKRDETQEKEADDRYAGLGQSFVDYYKNKT
jgi:hypothetical protein